MPHDGNMYYTKCLLCGYYIILLRNLLYKSHFNKGIKGIICICNSINYTILYRISYMYNNRAVLQPVVDHFSRK